MLFPERFDVIVVGGGHAGTEAALASARMGQRTLLLTHNLETLGAMSCNPSIGGIGRGIWSRKSMRWAVPWPPPPTKPASSSASSIHRKVRPYAPRAQADRLLYKQAIRTRLENQPNLTVFAQACDDLILTANASPAWTQLGVRFEARCRAHRRHLPQRPDPRRAGKLYRRPDGRPALGIAGGTAARTAVAGRLPEDRHAAATDGKTIDFHGDGRAALG